MNALLLAQAEEPQPPLIPHLDELVIGLIAFVIVFGFLAKKLLPNINKVLDERREAIEGGGIEKAESAQIEAQSVLEQYKAQLAEARHEAARLRQEATEQGTAIIQEMKAEGQRRSARRSSRPATRRSRPTARPRPRRCVRTWASSPTDLAGKLVGESLEDTARQSRTIDQLPRRARGEGRGCPMNGASREALSAARESLDALTDNTPVDATKLADELAAVTVLLDREVSLRRVLTDPAQSGEAKAELWRSDSCADRWAARPSTWSPAWCVPAGRVRVTWSTRPRSWRTPPTSPRRRRRALDVSRTSCSGSAGSLLQHRAGGSRRLAG
ncbi:ATP synthase subunit b [Streptomyces tanashiensis]